MRRVSITCALFLAAGSAGHANAAPATATATVGHTISCLHRHHVLADDQGVARAAGFHGGEWIHVTFTGIPAGALDAGAVIIEADHTAAVQAAKGVYSYLWTYDLKHVNGETKAYLRLVLPQILRVVGNAVELWNSAPVSRTALRVVSTCLAS